MTHLERALDHQNQWWKYLVLILVAFVGGQILGSIPLFGVIAYNMAGSTGMPPIDAEKLTDLTQYGISAHLGLLLLILPFIASLLLMLLLLKRLHQRTLAATINGTKRIRWGRVFFAAAVWAVLLAVGLGIFYAINPGNFQFRFQAASFIPLALISLLFIPFQSGFEEVLFRGYLAQGTAALTRSRWLAILIPSVLFALMHVANPEVAEFGFWLTMPQYFLMGAALGVISTLDDGIELAIGAHAANNIFASTIVTYKASALKTPALFNQLLIDPVQETWTMLLICVIFIAILAYKYKWNFAVLNRKVERGEYWQLKGDAPLV
jgi:uncharacterized protein